MLVKNDKNNNKIKTQIILIDADGTQLGSTNHDHALGISVERGLDLVKVGEKDGVPVFKLKDLGKEKYEKNKKKKNCQKVKLKQFEIRPSIDIGDIKIKASKINEHLKAGHKVKVTVKFKGREISHREVGEEKLKKLLELTSIAGKTDGTVEYFGNNISVNLVKA